MSTTISKGTIFRFTLAINDERLEKMNNSPVLAQKALQEGADYWHSKVMPTHFQQGASARYGYVARAASYLKQKHGKPTLVFSGSMRADLKAKAALKEAGSAGHQIVELKMWARVLNFVPAMPENSDAERVNHNRANHIGYPNLKREIKAITDDEREAVAQVTANALERFFGDDVGRESDD